MFLGLDAPGHCSGQHVPATSTWHQHSPAKALLAGFRSCSAPASNNPPILPPWRVRGTRALHYAMHMQVSGSLLTSLVQGCASARSSTCDVGAMWRPQRTRGDLGLAVVQVGKRTHLDAVRNLCDHPQTLHTGAQTLCAAECVICRCQVNLGLGYRLVPSAPCIAVDHTDLRCELFAGARSCKRIDSRRILAQVPPYSPHRLQPALSQLSQPRCAGFRTIQ